LTAAALIAHHRAAGREFSAAGVRSFVRCEGSGEDVLCLHGIPASSFLYRKVLPELAGRGLRGVAFDLPGLGLAARPATFSYTWTGHGAWCAAAVDELRLDTFHLVVHDYSGPVGFELCARAPDRIRSLTILNTVVDVEAFHRPWLVELLARRGIGEAVLQAVPHIVFRTVLTRLGIGDRRGIGDTELDAWLDLLRGTDRGRALLRMARDLERTREKRDLYVTTLRELSVPVQIVWGVDDPILRVDVHGEQARAATGAPLHRLPGRHFLQEDCFEAIGEHVARLAAAASAL
jgi:haloalkane dehalogenase